MRLKSKTAIIVMLIVLLAAFLRFWKLGQVPVSLYWDEVSIGYNAYSILKTGKDEYGQFLPVRFKAFGEYKLPAYVYLTSASVKIFGLNEFAVRFPSALFGTLTVLLTYFLTQEIFKKSVISSQLPVTSAFLLAISPWHLQLSRAGFEANLGLFFFCLGLLLLLKKRFLLAAIFLTAALYAYLSFWLTVPLTLLFFFLVLKEKKILLATSLILLLSLPLIYSVLFEKQQARFEQVSIFDEQTVLEPSLRRKSQAGNHLLARLFEHRFFIWGQTALRNYSLHFSPDFLFFKGDGKPRHTPYKMGLLFPITAPFMVLGFFKVLKSQEKLPLWLLLIAPMSAAFSLPAPHALRTELMVIPLQMMTALGLVEFFVLIKKSLPSFLKIASLVFLCLLFAFSFLLYWDNYYTHSRINQAVDWGDGYKEMLEVVKENQERFDRTFITGSRWQPYIYALFYLRYDPVKYQEEGSDHGHFGKYYFGETLWDEAGKSFYKTKVDFQDFLRSENNLLILSPDEAQDLPVFMRIDSIYSVKGTEIFTLCRS